MPKQINTPTPGQALVRLFGLKGRYQPVLDETIVPVVNVDQVVVRRPAEAYILCGAVALEFAFIRLTNPASSRVVIETEWMHLQPSAGNLVYGAMKSLSLVGTTPGTEQPGWRDSSLAGEPAAQLNVGSDPGAAVTGMTQQWWASTNGFDLPYVVRLYPGNAFLWWTPTVNVQWRVGLQWTEEYEIATLQ